MTTKIKQPTQGAPRRPNSAAAMARLLSRILKEDGFEKTDGAPKWEKDGFYVHRVGHSNTVCVDYYIFRISDSYSCRRRSKVAQMREVLFELGYISSQPRAIYIECRES